MKCTGKEWDTCRVEKMGCKGCHYDDIEIGEYIRNNQGYIDKVKKIIDKDEKMHNTYYCCESTMASSYKEEIKKHSKDILDLIELGDVLEIEEDGIICYIGIKKDTITLSYSDIKESIRNKKVKLLRILTHEQFKENCYEI